MKLGALLFLLFSFIASAHARAEVETCLLSYERARHPVSKHLLKKYADDDSIEVVIEARPVDLLHCVEAGARKIVLIAHAVSVPTSDSNRVVSLGYFRRLEDKERDEYITGWQEYLRDKEENKFYPIPNVLRRPLQRQKKKLAEAKRDVDFPLYSGIRIFLPRIFERLYDIVSSDESNRLESIHIMACETEELKKRYPAFHQLEGLGIQLAFAPKNKILSAIKDREVTNFSKRWIRKAVER